MFCSLIACCHQYIKECLRPVWSPRSMVSTLLTLPTLAGLRCLFVLNIVNMCSLGFTINSNSTFGLILSTWYPEIASSYPMLSETCIICTDVAYTSSRNHWTSLGRFHCFHNFHDSCPIASFHGFYTLHGCPIANFHSFHTLHGCLQHMLEHKTLLRQTASELGNWCLCAWTCFCEFVQNTSMNVRAR